VAVLPRRRDGAGKSYFVCNTMWGRGSATLLDYSSRLDLPARIADGWRFAPWLRSGALERRKNLHRGHRVQRVRGEEKTKRPGQKRPRICDEVGRGVGQGYFA
jgi:hypothetical protein